MVKMEHFIKRTEAYIIDSIVVLLFTALVNNLLYIVLSFINSQPILAYYPYVTIVIVTMAYYTIFEAKTNKTIGKRITGLYVSDIDGYMTYSKAFIRNLTKIYFVPIIVDVIIGRVLNFPSRLFDKFVGTDVYSDDELESY